MGSESAGTNWKEEFAKCTRRLEDAATLMDAIDSHQAVLDLLFGRMLYIYMQGWPESVKSSAIATLKEDIESYLEATRRLLTIVQRKEQLIWEFKSKPGDPSPGSSANASRNSRF